MKACLQTLRGETIPVGVTCSIGRSRDNHVALTSPLVSRHHALIHRQDRGEYWLVDLGSHNGSQLNDHRVQRPTLLKDGDRLEFGGSEFIFRPDFEPRETGSEETAKTQTAGELGTRRCWLLLADIKDSSKLAKEMPVSELAQVIGKWFLKCREVVESADGDINKYLGDGFLASWIGERPGSRQVRQVLKDLTEFQALRPAFRVVIHFGDVAVQRVTPAGNNELLGPDVNFAFKIERLAAQLQVSHMLSKPAAEAWPETRSLKRAGCHRVGGFDGEHEFFTL
jgi:adenylate cyclase